MNMLFFMVSNYWCVVKQGKYSSITIIHENFIANEVFKVREF